MAKNHALTYYAKRRAVYKAYLRSKEWKDLRLRVIVRDGGKCTNCGSTQRLHVHHEHYATFGTENLNDLRTLCEDCHNIHHGGSPRGMGRRARAKAAAAMAAAEDMALTPKQRKKAAKEAKNAIPTSAAYKATVRRAERAAKLAAIERIKELDRMTLAEIRRQVKARQVK